MKYLLAAACLALASCAAQKALPQLSEEQKRANERGIAYWQPDSTSQADTAPHTPRWAVAVPPVKVDSLSGKLVNADKLVEKPAGQRRIFGLLPPKKVASDKLSDGKLPRKCKGCTIVYGDAIVAEKKAQVAAGDGATASVIEKKAGPAQVASDSSTQNALLGGGNLANVHGDGNMLPQTATTQEAADWRATLAKPAGYVLAGLGTVLIVGGVIFLIVAYKRRNLLGNNG
jgi:hypothetical protein